MSWIVAYVRSGSGCPRVADGADGVPAGNYGTFAPAAWILRVGTHTAAGKGIAGVTLDGAPATLWLRYTSKDVAPSDGPDALAALLPSTSNENGAPMPMAAPAAITTSAVAPPRPHD